MYDLSALTPETWDQPRLCWYCEMLFTPERRQDFQQHFCSTPHRQAFNKYGKLPYERMMLSVRQEITRQVEEKFERFKNEILEQIACPPVEHGILGNRDMVTESEEESEGDV